MSSVTGRLRRAVVVGLCAPALALALAAPAWASTYFGATISGEAYGQAGNAPRNAGAWDLFERHAGRKVAILNAGQEWTPNADLLISMAETFGVELEHFGGNQGRISL